MRKTTVRMIGAALLAGAMIWFGACSLRKQEPTSVTPSLVNQFYLAAEAGDMYSVRYWTEKFPGLLIAKGKDFGLTALHGAAYGNHLDIVLFLLTADPENNPINIQSQGGNTALVEAVVHNHPEIVLALLDHGADFNLANNVGDTPLHWAAAKGNLDMVRLLLERGAEADAFNRDEESPLHLAAAAGHTDVIKLLLERGADPNARDKLERTPLQAAQNRNHEDAAELLRQRTIAN